MDTRMKPTDAFETGGDRRSPPPAVGRLRYGMRLKPNRGAPNRKTANASAALLVMLFFLACHGAPGVMHQNAHPDAAVAQHGQLSAGHAGDAHEAPVAQAHDASHGGSGMPDNDMSANYAAALLVLAFGAALLLAAARALRRTTGAILPRLSAPPRPRWRPPPPPTLVRLQVFWL